MRVRAGLGEFRAAVDAVRQPFSVNVLAQAAAAEALLHSDDVLGRVERTIVERITSRSERGTGLDPPEAQANFSWIALGDRDEEAVVQGLASGGSRPRRHGLGGPGHIRVTYGTRGENERFLEALEEAVS